MTTQNHARAFHVAKPCFDGNLWPRKLFVALLVLTLIGLSGGGCMLSRKQPLNWHLTLQLDSNAADRDGAVLQTVKILETRLNAWGVKSFQLTPQHAGRILLALSAEKNPERLKSFITTSGRLDLIHVVSPSSPAPVQTYQTKEAAIASLNSDGAIPADRRVLPLSERDDPFNQKKWVVVEWPAIVSGSDLRTADAVPSGASDSYEIVFRLNKAGAEKFGAWTGANVNEYLGVALNDEVKSVAFIKSQILDSGVITGRFSKESADDLALVLRSGALPATLKIVEERIDK
jgi:preprotein translocase subunit SecD